MTVVPLFCAKLIKRHQADEEVGQGAIDARLGFVTHKFNSYFEKMLGKYDRTLSTSLLKPVATVAALAGGSLLCLALYPFLGVSFFPRTDPGQFVINLKAPSGTRVELTENYVKQVEELIRRVVPPDELQIIVSNIGITTDFSAIYTPNSAPHTAFVQVSLKEGHKVGSYEYMRRVRAQLSQSCRNSPRTFSLGASWMRGDQSRPARAHRHPGQRKQSRQGLWHSHADSRSGPRIEKRQRRAHPPRHRLPRIGTRCRPRESGTSRLFRRRRSSTT